MIPAKKELKKNIATIHCANSLSLLQRKISNALLFHAYHNLKLQEEHEISIRKLCEIIGYAGHNTEVIKKAIKGLITTLIEWNLVDEIGQEDWSASTILASVRLYNGLCIYAYSPRMKDLLFSPKIYGRINITVQTKFKSSYGLALYENCVRYQGLPQTRWFELSVFRKLMGVPENKYLIFRDFNRRVLSKAVEEVNLYSNLEIEAELQRKERVVTAIRFKLKEVEKTNDEPVFENKNISIDVINEKQKNIFEKLCVNFLVNEKMAKIILNKYELSFINEKITMIENSKTYQNGEIGNLSGYLLTALKDDYKISEIKKTVVLKEKRNADLNDNKINTLEQAKDKYSNFVMAEIEKYINGLNQDALQILQTSFNEKILAENEFALNRFNKSGITDHMIKALFKVYIKDTQKVDYLSFEDWNSRFNVETSKSN